MSYVTESDVGKFFIGPDGEVWRLVMYCEYPTCTFERVNDASAKVGGAVGSPNVSGFTRLIREDEIVLPETTYVRGNGTGSLGVDGPEFHITPLPRRVDPPTDL